MPAKNYSFLFISTIIILQIVTTSPQNIFEKDAISIIESSTARQHVNNRLTPSDSNGKPLVDKTECSRHVGIFTFYDYSILLGMLVISLGIGVFYGFFNSSENTTADFLHGSEMSLLPVSLSLTTSFITAIELLGNPSEMVFNGTQFSLIGK